MLTIFFHLIQPLPFVFTAETCQKTVKEKKTKKPKLCDPSLLSFLIYGFSLEDKKNSFKKVLVTYSLRSSSQGTFVLAKGRFCYLGAVICLDAVAADATTSFPSAFWRCIN